MEYLYVFLITIPFVVVYVPFENWARRKLEAPRASTASRDWDAVAVALRAADPGPLDTPEKLRAALCSPVLNASKTLDRIQDAFDAHRKQNKRLLDALASYIVFDTEDNQVTAEFKGCLEVYAPPSRSFKVKAKNQEEATLLILEEMFRQ